jgi:choline dehydrogenase-like flavoprotein
VIDNARVVQGVELQRSGHFKKFVRSHKEVVLSAGAINTPHILLQSGVGPQAHLHKHGVSFSAQTYHTTHSRAAVEGGSLALKEYQGVAVCVGG